MTKRKLCRMSFCQKCKLYSHHKEGFSLDVVTIPGTQAATTFESAINSFTKTYNTYISSGYSEADALAAVNTSLSQKTSVSLLSGKSVTSHSGIFYCFSYLGWVLLVMMIAGIAPVLQVFSKKKSRREHPAHPINLQTTTASCFWV